MSKNVAENDQIPHSSSIENRLLYHNIWSLSREIYSRWIIIRSWFSCWFSLYNFVHSFHILTCIHFISSQNSTNDNIFTVQKIKSVTLFISHWKFERGVFIYICVDSVVMKSVCVHSTEAKTSVKPDLKLHATDENSLSIMYITVMQAKYANSM